MMPTNVLTIWKILSLFFSDPDCSYYNIVFDEASVKAYDACYLRVYGSGLQAMKYIIIVAVISVVAVGAAVYVHHRYGKRKCSNKLIGRTYHVSM